MRISKQARRTAKELLRACQVGGLLDEGRVRAAVNAVATGKPRGYHAILSHFHRLVKLDLQRRQGRVESAVPLTPALQAGVRGNLEKLYGPGLDLAFAPNPALIGGMRVRVGSDVYDGSIAARLAQFEQAG